MASPTVTFINNTTAWQRSQEPRLLSMAKKMGYAILATSRVKAPMSENGGNMRNSGRVRQGRKSIIVSYGGIGGVNYAHAQEKGTNGIVVFRHYTTPGTGAHYLKDTGDIIAQKGLGTFA